MPTSDNALVGPPALGVSEVELDGQVCLYSPAGEHVVVLNDTASDVWRLADGERTVGQIITLLAGVYGCTPADIGADVHAAVESFRAALLLP